MGAEEPMAVPRMRKSLVENALTLHIAAVMKVIAAGSQDPTTVYLHRRDCIGEALAVRLTPGADGGSVRVDYYRLNESLSYVLDLVPLRQRFGGVRRLLRCPLVGPDGNACRRRVRALYLPERRRYFGCRWCHDLTYRSSQEPVASRIRTVARRLERCQRDLESRNVRVQARALRDVRRTVAMLLDRPDDPPVRYPQAADN
jgi:hypothetical protein